MYQASHDFSRLSARTRNVLAKLGVKTLEQLQNTRLADILYLPNSGPATAKELVDFLWRRI